MTMTATPKKPGPRPRAPRERLPAEVIAGLVDAAGKGDQNAWNRLVHEFDSLIWAITRAHRRSCSHALYSVRFIRQLRAALPCDFRSR